MTAVDAGGQTSMRAVWPAPAAPSRSEMGATRFHGSERAFLRILVRGAVFLMLTLGIYRFWLATDVRRFLWGNTEVAGEMLEYTGTPLELLVGFLMALALLLPLNGLIFLSTFAPTLLPFSGAIGFGVLILLGQFAVYRARRYRLTRTIFRGVRLYQTGAAWRYALRSVLWWTLNLLTLGLSYPWSQASLERYKLRHTHYGDLNGRFVGSGTRLFMRGVLFWLIVVAPFAAATVAAIALIDWFALATVLAAPGDPSWARIENASPYFAAAIVFAILGTGWSVLAAALLYPAFRAMVLRWWVSGLRLGRVTATSHLRTAQIYRVYLRFLGYSLLFAILAGLLAAVAGGALTILSRSFGTSSASEIAASVLFIGTYVVIALGYSTIYQATVTIRFWRLSLETTELSGLQELDNVAARGGPSSPFGEGLADALDVGGL